MPTLQRRALNHVTATRYVLPLREGGSLPALMECDDLGTYVVKFRGAGQGRKALVAEIIAAELARAIGLRVPEQVLVEVDPEIARAEPDQEVQDLLRASAGGNLGVDYLPRSFGFDPAADTVDPATAAAVLWFDALIENVDRSWRNPNLLRWHGEMWLIDHGAALYFHHNWATRATVATRAYTHIAEHVLLTAAGPIPPVGDSLAALLTPDTIRAATDAIPDEWLADEPGFDAVGSVRDAYVETLGARLANRDAWAPALEVARAGV